MAEKEEQRQAQALQERLSKDLAGAVPSAAQEAEEQEPVYQNRHSRRHPMADQVNRNRRR